MLECMTKLQFVHDNVIDPTQFAEGEAFVIFAHSVDDKAKLFDPHGQFTEITDSLHGLNISGATEQITKLWSASLGTVVYVAGLGTQPTNNTNASKTLKELRNVSGAVTRNATGHSRVTYYYPTSDIAQLTALLEGIGLGNYRFTQYKNVKESSFPASAINVISEATPNEFDDALRNASVIVEAIRRTKDLVNTPAIDLYPSNFAEMVQQGIEGLPIDIQIWDENQLEDEGFGGITGVGRGSARPPRLVKLSYKPQGAKKHLALVGKGITFDTGGLSLKPANAMVGMKYDMTGAATVYATIRAAAELKLPVQITSWLCLAENMPSGSATRPNDVLTIKGGKTVEVLNTDAEGRLVLADGLVAASDEHPDFIVDVATLTGAAIVAVGTNYTPVLGNDDFVDTILQAADEAGEQFWQLPLDKGLRKSLDSDIADIANVKIGSPAGGTITGALFLADFVGNTASDENTQISWAHLDIAPTANTESAEGYSAKGATGVAVRTLIQLAANLN